MIPVVDNPNELYLMVSDYYCAGDDNSYWDTDDDLDDLIFAPDATRDLAAALSVEPADLPEELVRRIRRPRRAVDEVVKLADAHSVPWARRTGSPREDMDGELRIRVSGNG